MIDFLKYRNFAIVLVCLFIAAVQIFMNFPIDSDYSPADESVYYHQAQQIELHGLDGFKTVAQGFLLDNTFRIFPNPFRILPMVVNAMALSISDSMRALSVVSLICFILLCLVAEVLSSLPVFTFPL